MRTSTVKKIDPLFLERWSPRAFSSQPIANEDIEALFEAARWSPSCFNEQPWRFVYATEEEHLKLFRSVLVEANQSWANKAPLLIFIFSKNNFSHNGKPNRWAEFDAGAAWMSLALQARKLGLYAHGMGGFSEQEAFSVTGVDDLEYRVICAVAVGRLGDINHLPADMRERETASDRKEFARLVFKNSMPAG